MIISTRFIPKGFDAMTLWPLIFIRPEQRKFRLAAEVRATGWALLLIKLWRR